MCPPVILTALFYSNTVLKNVMRRTLAEEYLFIGVKVALVMERGVCGCGCDDRYQQEQSSRCCVKRRSMYRVLGNQSHAREGYDVITFTS
jgi:hypothetical protein